MLGFEVVLDFKDVANPTFFVNYEVLRSSVAVRNYEKRWVTLCVSGFVRCQFSSAKRKIVHCFVKSAQPNLQELNHGNHLII